MSLSMRIDCASGSSESAKRNRLSGHPCQEPLAMSNNDEQVLPVSTMAVGFAYSTFIIRM